MISKPCYFDIVDLMLLSLDFMLWLWCHFFWSLQSDVALMTNDMTSKPCQFDVVALMPCRVFDVRSYDVFKVMWLSSHVLALMPCRKATWLWWHQRTWQHSHFSLILRLWCHVVALMLFPLMASKWRGFDFMSMLQGFEDIKGHDIKATSLWCYGFDAISTDDMKALPVWSL